MSNYTEHDEFADQAHGEGSFGISDGFYERAKISGGDASRVIQKYRISIPEDVDHFREERKQNDYGLESEKEYAASLAKRRFTEDYGFQPGIGARFHFQHFREEGFRASEGYRTGFIVRIDTNPGHEHDYPEPEPESDIFLEDNDE